jgi:hypothetical protein
VEDIAWWTLPPSGRIAEVQLCDKLKGDPRDDSHGGKAERWSGRMKPWRKKK